MTTETKFKYAIVRLSKKSNHSNIFDLKFKLLDNSFVPKWIDCVLLAQQLQYPISEPWAFYNHSNDPNCKNSAGFWHQLPVKYLVTTRPIKAGEELTAKYTLYMDFDDNGN